MENELQEPSEAVELKTESAPVENESSTQLNDVEVPVQEKRTVPEDRFKQVYAKSKGHEREIAELKQQLASRGNQEPTQVLDTSAPTLESFDYDQDKYDDARFNFRMNQEFKKRDEQTKANAQKQDQQNLLSSFDQQAASYASENEDYQKAIEEVGNAGYSETINQVLLNSEKGAQLDHFLLRNPVEISKLSSMNSVQQMMHLGKLESTLGTQKTIKQSNAPEPIETVKGTSSVTAPEYKTGMSDADYFNMRRGKKALRF